MDKRLFRDILKIIVFVVALVLCVVKFDLIVAALRALGHVLTPVLLGFVLAFVLHRPCKFFRRKLSATRLKRAATPLAVTASYVIFFAVIAALLAFIIPQIGNSFLQFAGSFPDYFAHAQALITDLIQRFDLTFLEQVDLPSVGTILQNLLSKATGLITNLSAQVFSLTSNLIGWVVDLFLGFIFSVYMLSSSDKLLAQCRRLVVTYLPKKVSEPVLDVARLSATTFTNFVAGQLTEACILGSLCFLGMCIFRFDYAPLISVIVGVSALIPIVGAFLGAILSALLLAMISPLQALWFLIFLITLQQVEGNVIYPRVVGRSIGLPGIWVLTAVTVGGGLFQFWGLILAVPIVSVLYTLLQRDLRRRVKRKPNTGA